MTSKKTVLEILEKLLGEPLSVEIIDHQRQYYFGPIDVATLSLHCGEPVLVTKGNKTYHQWEFKGVRVYQDPETKQIICV